MDDLRPSSQCPLPEEFRPALAWKAQLSQVERLPAGKAVRYGHVYSTRGEEKIGPVPFVCGDGSRRVDGNIVLVGGKRVPVIGRACLDQVMVQLDDICEASECDEVVLIGRQGEAKIRVEEIADRWGTITYEVVCGTGGRIPRMWV